MKKNLLSIASFVVVVSLLWLAAFDKPVKPVKEVKRPGGMLCAPSLDSAKLNEPGAPLLNGLGNLRFADDLIGSGTEMLRPAPYPAECLYPQPGRPVFYEDDPDVLCLHHGLPGPRHGVGSL